MNTVRGLLHANFIFGVKYIEWLFNVVLVKNVFGKWRMCVNYINLKWAFPKDLYRLPNIEKLEDNYADYKKLLFMDTYSKYNWNLYAQIGQRQNLLYDWMCQLQMRTHAIRIEECRCNIS